MASLPCDDPLLKRAALFFAITGLRWSDVRKIQEIHLDRKVMNLRYRQKKRKSMEVKYLSRQAIGLLDTSDNPRHQTFGTLQEDPTTTINARLASWMQAAGISKHITFHCFRHTYATIQLTLGTDIYIFSKELGYKSLKNTEIYAKIVDSKKKEAVLRIPEIRISNQEIAIFIILS